MKKNHHCLLILNQILWHYLCLMYVLRFSIFLYFGFFSWYVHAIFCTYFVCYVWIFFFLIFFLRILFVCDVLVFFDYVRQNNIEHWHIQVSSWHSEHTTVDFFFFLWIHKTTQKCTKTTNKHTKTTQKCTKTNKKFTKSMNILWLYLIVIIIIIAIFTVIAIILFILIVITITCNLQYSHQNNLQNIQTYDDISDKEHSISQQ